MLFMYAFAVAAGGVATIFTAIYIAVAGIAGVITDDIEGDGIDTDTIAGVVIVKVN